MNTLLKAGDLLLCQYNNRYHPIKVMKDSSNMDDFLGRSAEMRMDYNYKNHSENVICNLGDISFTDFYHNYEELCPEYKTEIKKEFDFIVSLIDIKRENDREIPVHGTTKLEVYMNKIAQFPLG